MNKTICKIGFWSGLIAFFATLAFCIVQIFQMVGVLSYPLDEILIYSTSLCIVIPFIIEILALHYITPEHKKFWSHAALIFTTIYAVFVSFKLCGSTGNSNSHAVERCFTRDSGLKQTPHSLFWDFDAIGYISMGFATLFAVPMFEKHGFQKWVRLSFLANALATPLFAIVYFYPTFSKGYIFLDFPGELLLHYQC